MVKTKNVILGVILCTIMALCLTYGTFDIKDANEIAYAEAQQLPNCSVTWEIIEENGEKVLYLGGSGDMYAMAYDRSNYDSRPWHSEAGNISKIVIGDEVTSIGQYSFYGFSKIKEVVFPTSMNDIGEAAFENCSELDTVIIKSATPKYYINPTAFNDCDRDLKFYVPAGSVQAYKEANYWSYYENYYVTYYTIADILGTAEKTFPTSEEDAWQNSDGVKMYNYVFDAFSVLQIGDSVCPPVTNGCTIDSYGNYLYTASEYTVTFIMSNSKLTKIEVESDTYEISGTYAPVPKVDDEFTVNGINYVITSFGDENTVTVGDNTAFAGTSVTIPATVSYGDFTFDVTEIGDSAFEETGITSVSIPNSVVTIGESAFESCESLTSVTFAKGSALTTINEYAFYDCGITEIELPASLTTIDERAFCGNPLSEIEIPANVTTIDEGVFDGCINLTSVTFAENSKLATIGLNAFNSCVFTEIKLPASVTDIGAYAFKSCSNLTTFKILSTKVPTLVEGAFEGCESLEKIIVPSESLSAYQEATNWSAYADKLDGLTPIVGDKFTDENGINYVVTSIGETKTVKVGNNKAFTGTSVTIPATVTYKDVTFDVTEISANAFEDTGITSVTIPNSVVTIGDYAFAGTYLASVTIPNSVETIKAFAFAGAEITEVTIPNSVVTIGDSAFDGNVNLATVTFAENSKLKTIGTHVFGGSIIESIEIPASVTTIDEGAFDGCINLTSVTFAENSKLQTIGVLAFGYTNISKIEIPASVTAIGESCFGECSSLTTVSVLATVVPTLGEFVFEGCDNLEKIIVPAESLSEYKNASNWSTYADKIARDKICLTALNYLLINDKSLHLLTNDNTYLFKLKETLQPGTTYYFTDMETDFVGVLNDKEELATKATDATVSFTANSSTIKIVAAITLNGDNYEITYETYKVSFNLGESESSSLEMLGTAYSIENNILTVGINEITPMPSFGYELDYWTIGDTKLTEGGTITGPVTFTAVFKEKKMTILDIFPSNFPTDQNNGWVNAAGNKIYMNSDELCIDDTLTLLNTSKILTKDGDNYIMGSIGGWSVVFNITNNKVSSITFDAKNEDYKGLIGEYKSIQSVTKPTADTTNFVYNGEEQTYQLATNDAYTISENTKQTAVGTYIITVSLKNAYYKWADGTTDDLTYDFVINQKVEDVVVKDEQGQVVESSPVSIVGAENGIAPDAVFVVKVMNIEKAEDTEATEDALNDAGKIGTDEKIFGIYDAKLIVNDVEVQPNGRITIKMAVPEELIGKEFKLYHIHNGNEIYEVTYSDVDENGFITFETDKLSQFAFIGEDENAKAPAAELSAGTVAGIVIGTIIGSIILTIIITFVVGKISDKKKKNLSL